MMSKTKKRFSIRRQALLRLFIVIGILTIGISIIGTNAFITRQNHEIAQKQQVSRAFYDELLPRLENQWQTQVEQSRARIELTRILEEDPVIRCAKLTTFLTAQWEFIDFSNLILLSANGDIQFRYGTEATRLSATPETIRDGWFQIKESEELFRVFAVPIWMGDAGQGTLVLYKSMNTGTLQSLQTPETHLHLHFQGRIFADSDPRHVSDAMPGADGLHADASPPVIQTDIHWPHNSPQAPTLIVHREFKDSISLREFMQRPLAAITLVAIMIWFGLGRWLTKLVRRIESIGSAIHGYADSGSTQDTSLAMATARAVPDEIEEVADTLEYMMQSIQERDREQRSYVETLSMLEEAVLELDCDGKVTNASPGWYRISRVGYDVRGKAINEFIHLDDVDSMYKMCESFRQLDKTNAQLRIRLRTDSDTEQWAECRMIAQRDADGKLSGIRGVLRDITQTYLHEQQITHMALHDALTDLPNRVLLEDRIKIATRMASRGDHRVAVCFIDLDHFKKINDSLGHKVGDRLLKSFSSTLRNQLRTGDTLARWGGDEFVLLLPELDSAGDAQVVTRKVEEALKQPIRLDEHTDHVVTFSMGVAMYPDDALDVESLLTHADRAMFYAKAQGRNQTCFFGDVADKEGSKRELYIQNKLIEAVSDGRIQAWFQPIITADTGTCEVIEVLARWHDPEFGWVSPATFIPIAENTGVIRELGQLIWQQSITAVAKWRDAGWNIRAAINVSKRQLFAGQFAEQLVEGLEANGLTPEAVIIEVTESVALLDVANASDRLEALSRLGFHLAIDDFGTGYSACSYRLNSSQFERGVPV